MRLAILCLHTSPWARLGTADAGGMNVVLRHLSAEFARAGHEVRVYVRRMDASAPAVSTLAPGLTLHQVDAGPPVVLPKSEIDEWIDDYTAAVSREPRPDVLHAHHWMSGMAGLELSRIWDVPLVASFHSVAAPSGAPLSAGEPPESPDRCPGEVRIVREADALVAVSRAEAATLERLGADPERLCVIRPGVDAELFRPAETARAEGMPQTRAPYVLVAARLQPLKGVDLAVEAIAGIGATADRPAPRLCIAGDAAQDFADYQRALDERIDELGVADRIDRVGGLEREEFVPLMQHAELVLVPSHSETFGLVALEAAACGVPTVAAPSGGLHEAVSEGVSGVIVPSRDPRQWQDAVRGLLDDAPRRVALGVTSRAWAETQGWDEAARTHLSLYAGLVSGRPAAAVIAELERARHAADPSPAASTNA